MSTPALPLPCYLDEWFASSAVRDMALDRVVSTLGRCAALLSHAGSQVRLIEVLAVPTDDYVFAVFTASAAEHVALACEQAGLPAQRLTAALDARPSAPVHPFPTRQPSQGSGANDG